MVGQAEQVVTGDAVVLDVQIAQLPVRALSALIDIAVIFVGYVARRDAVGARPSASSTPRLSGAVLVIFTVLDARRLSAGVRKRDAGRTLGKMALGLRVVSDDGGPERFRQALFRALASVVEIWMFFGGPAVICSLLSPKGKRIGDVFAGTVVISERGPKLPPPPVMPPSLAWWASSLQLSGLGPEQAELARQFLSRASQLDPQIRDQMAHRIAVEVVARISPPPPPGVPPQYVLAAVLAERHRRELDRLRPAPAQTPPPPPPWGAPAQWTPPAQAWPPVQSPPVAPPPDAGGFAPPG